MLTLLALFHAASASCTWTPTTTCTVGAGQTYADVTSAIASGCDGIQVYGSIQDNVVSTLPDIRIAGATPDAAIESAVNGASVIDLQAGRACLTGLKISGAVGATCGGGVHIAAGVEADLDLLDVRDNDAALGGGICSEGTLLLEDSAVEANLATEGGGLYLDYGLAGLALVERTSLSNNTATDGGGLAARDIPDVTHVLLRDCTVHDNDAIDDGGGLHLVNAQVRTDGTGFDATFNYAADNGGGAYLEAGGEIRINTAGSRAEFFGNFAGGNGGGVAARSGGRLSLANSGELVVSNNYAVGGDGGGVWLWDGELVDDDVGANGLPGGIVVIDFNATQSNRGGGVFGRDCHISLVGSSAFIGNQALSGAGGNGYLRNCATEIVQTQVDLGEAVTGGGLYLTGDSSTTALRRGRVSDNTASASGGGIRLVGGADLIGQNLLVVGNDANEAGGVQASPQITSTLTLNHATLADNTSTTGAHQLAGSATTEIRNSAFAGASGSACTYLGVPAAVSYSTDEDSSCVPAGIFNNTTDPLLVDANYYPLSGSPLLDTGNSVFTRDWLNWARPGGTANDRGACETQ